MLRVARQPLLWSPLAGLSLRLVPAEIVTPLRATLEPLGRTAAPVSMVLLGLYLWTHRDALRLDAGARGSLAIHVAARIVLVPLVTLAMILPASRLGWLALDEARVLLILAAMPAAITTFAIALEQGIGSDRVAAAIVGSTLGAALTLPLVTWFALGLGAF